MAAPERQPSVAAFEGRRTDVTESGVTEPRNRRGHSSFPHLTPATPERAAHVTDVRRVATVVGDAPGQRFEILQRFHQDDVAGATPTFDRFVAVDSATGRVHNTNVALNPAVHQPHGAVVPARGVTLADSRRANLTFTVGVETDHPPLSPRSRQREVPDTGHR